MVMKIKSGTFKKECEEVASLPPARLPKKEWDYLSKRGFLTKKQVKFLKKAEELGYEVDIRPMGISSTNLMRGNFSWTETEVVISTTLKNEVF